MLFEVLLTLLCVTSFISLTMASYSGSKLADLGPRFNRILSMVQNSKPAVKVLADVGCDHGLLSGRVASFDTVDRVFGIDVSVAAAKGACAYFESLPVVQRDKLELLIGDGLSPLVKKGITNVDTIVMSGMGVGSVFDMLSTHVRNENVPESADNEVINTKLLDSLGVTNIIVQPWPPNFLPLQSFFSFMLKNGDWEFEEQGIDYLNGYHHITTRLRRSQGQEGKRVATRDDILNIQCNPLYKRCHNQCSMSSAEAKMWRQYLWMQRKSLLRRQKGLSARKNVAKSNPAVDAPPTLSSKGQRRAIPYFDLDKVIALLDNHVHSMDGKLDSHDVA